MDRSGIGLLFPLLLLLSALLPLVVCETTEELKAECLMWSHLENKTLPLQEDGHARCTTNTDCTGFSCDGQFKGSAVSFGMRVHQCQEPPGLEIFGNAPQFLQSNFSHIFQDGAKYQVPPAILNLQNLSGLPELPFGGNKIPGVNLYFKVNLEPNNVNLTFNTLKIGLEIQACVNHSAMGLNANIRTSKALEGEEVCIMNKPLFDDAIIPVPHCIQTYPAQPLVGDSCNINDLFGCGDHQTCTQEMPEDPAGICECMAEFTMNPDKSCGERRSKPNQTKPNSRQPKSSIKDVDPEDLAPQPHTAAVEPAGSGAAVAAGVVSVLVILALLALLAFLVHRHRLLPRMRAKLRHTPYEDIVITDSTSSRPRV